MPAPKPMPASLQPMNEQDQEVAEEESTEKHMPETMPAPAPCPPMNTPAKDDSKDAAATSTQKTVEKLAKAARRADARKQISEAGLPQPPPVPEEKAPSPTCPMTCDCGQPCTRIERMIRHGTRNFLKHRHHKCDRCQDSWKHGGNRASASYR